MKPYICSALLVAAVAVTAPVAIAATRPAAAPVPATPAFKPDVPQDGALLAAWQQAGYHFTPAFKARWLARAKGLALADIGKAGLALPADFLAWVDSDPVVAATVYGIAPDSARRLVFLRSLEIDLGPQDVREKHLQLALALTDKYAHLLDPVTLVNPAIGVSLRERGRFQLRISGDPRVRVDTHPTERPLDLNDHIINFLEANPVVSEVKTTKVVNGAKVVSVARQSRPAYACEVMSQPALQEAFNKYMKEHGQSVAIDCGNSISPWSPKKGGIMQAFKLFLDAYQAKGLLPRRGDPAPTPVEKAAYLIRNDNFRFPENVKRSWPRFPLNAPWPVLDYLVSDGTTLREREFIWERFRDHNIAVGYGAYIGGIAQYPPFVKARRLQPFDFAYDTYPMRLKDGGVCGTMSNIGRALNIALGVPANQASQPGHSCFVAVGGNDHKGYGLSIGQSATGGPASTGVSGRGSYLNEAIKFYPVNYGLLPYLDARIVQQVAAMLPENTPVKHRLTLLRDGFTANPYNLAIVTAIQDALASPLQQVAFWQLFDTTLNAIDKPGCPKTSHYNTVVRQQLNVRLARLPLPADAGATRQIAAFLATSGDAVWLKYQQAASGLPAVMEKLAACLKLAVAGTRTPQDSAVLAKQITTLGNAIKEQPAKINWANRMLSLLAGHEFFTTGTGKAAKSYPDPCVIALRELLGSSQSVTSAFANSLQVAISNNSRTANSCKLASDWLTVISKNLKNPKERAAFGQSLLAIITGRESYVPNPAKPAELALDPCCALIYALGADLAPAKLRLASDLKAAIAGSRTPNSSTVLSQRLQTLSKQTRDPKERLAWGEALLPLIAGHENYTSGARQLKDPCAAIIYNLAGRKMPADPPPATKS